MEALHALSSHRRCSLDQVIDLSATPIFINPGKTRVPAGTPALKASTLVPWVVSEFALMESMDAGLVKIPQPPCGSAKPCQGSGSIRRSCGSGAPIAWRHRRPGGGRRRAQRRLQRLLSNRRLMSVLSVAGRG